MGIKWLFIYLYLWRPKRLLMFSHMNLLSPAIGDPISVPTQDMLMGLYVLTSGNRRGISVNRYNPGNRGNSQRSSNNNYDYTKEPFFYLSSLAYNPRIERRLEGKAVIFDPDW